MRQAWVKWVFRNTPPGGTRLEQQASLILSGCDLALCFDESYVGCYRYAFMFGFSMVFIPVMMVYVSRYSG
jgi:hypothetical protein